MKFKYKIGDRVLCKKDGETYTVKATIDNPTFNAPVYIMEEDYLDALYFESEIELSGQVITPFEYLCNFLKIKEGEMFDIVDEYENILYSMVIGDNGLVFVDDNCVDADTVLIDLMKSNYKAVPCKTIEIGGEKMRVSQKIYSDIIDIIEEADDTWVEKLWKKI